MTSSYFSFMIRIWKASTGELPAWHASLEVPSTHETVYFQSVSDCLDYLRNLEIENSADNAENAKDAGEPDHEEFPKGLG